MKKKAPTKTATKPPSKTEPRTVAFPPGFLDRLRVFAATHHAKGYTAQGVIVSGAEKALADLEALAKAKKLPNLKA